MIFLCVIIYGVARRGFSAIHLLLKDRSLQMNDKTIQGNINEALIVNFFLFA